MSDSRKQLDYSSIETWEDLRKEKLALRAEIDDLGGNIAASAREVVMKGVKVTAATVASVAVAKGVAAYARMRREKDAVETARTTGPIADATDSIAPDTKSPQSPDPGTQEDGNQGRLTSLFMYIDILIKLIHAAREVYDGIQEFGAESVYEEE